MGLASDMAVREFQTVFILTILREQKRNQLRAAQRLGMHRNTLRRTLRKLELDIKLLRPPAGHR
jgi:DNA-binding protein Fis